MLTSPMTHFYKTPPHILGESKIIYKHITNRTFKYYLKFPYAKCSRRQDSTLNQIVGLADVGYLLRGCIVVGAMDVPVVACALHPGV